MLSSFVLPAIETQMGIPVEGLRRATSASLEPTVVTDFPRKFVPANVPPTKRLPDLSTAMSVMPWMAESKSFSPDVASCAPLCPPFAQTRLPFASYLATNNSKFI